MTMKKNALLIHYHYQNVIYLIKMHKLHKLHKLDIK